MRSPHVLLMIPLFLVFCCFTAGVGEDNPPDPSVSLHPTDNIVALAKLRPLLAKSPEDQYLLGLALMCYVNLALSGEEENEGASGPWLTYATALAERRIKARDGARLADFSAAEPELWMRLLQGYRQEVVDALAQWPHEAQSPRHRALAVLASTDWRAFLTHKPQTLHERYSALRTGFEVWQHDLMDHLEMREPRHNPFVVAEMMWRSNRWGAPVTTVRETVAFTVWMLASSELDDAAAKPLLQELADAFGVVLNPGLMRKDCWQLVMAAARRIENPDPVVIGTAMAICERLQQRTHGMVAGDGSLQLYGLGDLASWNRDRCFMTTFYGYIITRSGNGSDFDRTDRKYVSKLRERMPGSLTATRYSLGYQGNSFINDDKPAGEMWDSYADAVAQELARTPRHSHAVLAIALAKLAIGRPERAAPLLRQLVDGYDGVPPRVALERLVQAADLTGEIPLILPALRHWSQAAPMDQDLHKLLHKWSPTKTMLSLDARKPLRSWRDATIDNRKLPWPGLELSQRFAIRWRGALRIDHPGSYLLGTESDDGSRLAIGEVVVDNSGNHAMRVRRMRAELEPGWLPLSLEYSQGSGEGGCRLLWQPPGSNALVTIPAANLAEGEGRPGGLVADGFDQSRQPAGVGPSSDEIAYVRSMPWHLRVQHDFGNDLWENGRYADALTCFNAILALEPEHHVGRRAAQCLLWSDPPNVDAAIPLMRKHPHLWTKGWELTWTVSRLRKLGRLQEVVDAIGAQNRDDELWPFVRGYAALDRGDLRTARDELAKLMGEGGPGDRFMPNPDLNMARLDWAVLNRLDGKETDWGEVERGIQRNGGIKPFQELVLDWLSNSASWEDCVVRVPMVQDGEDIYYFQGLMAMTTGDHATAKMRFQEVIDKHPTWMEVPTCKALLKWYETQTPESLAKVATAKPLGKPATQPAKPRPDANDF